MTLATDYDEFPQTLYFLIGCLIPLLMIVISYLVIWIYVNLSVGSARYESNDQRVKGLRAPKFLLAALALFILTVV